MLKKLGHLEVVYMSIHLLEKFPDDPDNDFFPGSGEELSSSKVFNVPILPLWVKRKKRKRPTSSLLQGKSGFHKGIQKISEKIKQKPPDFLLFSAGFDAAQGDEGSTYQGKAQLTDLSRCYLKEEILSFIGKVGLDITSKDFESATATILSVCKVDTKVISILEGGYGSWAAHQGKYDRSDLVTSFCRHLKALTQYANKRLKLPS